MTEEQTAVFNQLRAMLSKHVPPLVVIKDEPEAFHLTGTKPAVIWGRKRDSVWFAGLAVTKKGITLHFMPVYGNAELGEELPAVFMKTLKGQACFHVGNLTPELADATEEAIAIGIEAYRTREWL